MMIRAMLIINTGQKLASLPENPGIGEGAVSSDMRIYKVANSVDTTNR